MDRVLDLSASVFALCAQYPELKEILHGIGFSEITKLGMINTVGRFMTLPKGAAMKGIPLETVIEALRRHGYDARERKV